MDAKIWDSTPDLALAAHATDMNDNHETEKESSIDPSTNAWAQEIDKDDEVDNEYEKIDVQFNGEISAWDDRDEIFTVTEPPRVTVHTVDTLRDEEPSHDSRHVLMKMEDGTELEHFQLRSAENGKPMRGSGKIYKKKEDGVSQNNGDKELNFGWFRIGFRYEWEFRLAFNFPTIWGKKEELRAI